MESGVVAEGGSDGVGITLVAKGIGKGFWTSVMAGGSCEAPSSVFPWLSSSVGAFRILSKITSSELP
jgi:hypothetical protein